MWWIIATLILLGIILMFCETLLLPGLGIAGVLSFCSFGGACWYAFTYVSRAAGIWTTVGCCVVLLVLLFFLLRSKTWNRFALKEEIASKVNEEPSRVEPGQQGKALTRLAPMGTAEFGSLTCEVKSHDNTMVAAGTPVEVVRIDDNKVIVKPLN